MAGPDPGTSAPVTSGHRGGWGVHFCVAGYAETTARGILRGLAKPMGNYMPCCRLILACLAMLISAFAALLRADENWPGVLGHWFCRHRQSLGPQCPRASQYREEPFYSQRHAQIIREPQTGTAAGHVTVPRSIPCAQGFPLWALFCHIIVCRVIAAFSCFIIHKVV